MAKEKLDFPELAEKCVELSGGARNIKSITHCMTRLRFIIADKSKVDTDAIQDLDKVLGVVYNADELQIVLGANLMDTYNEVAKMPGMSESAPVDENLDGAGAPREKRSVRQAVIDVIDFVSASVTPLVPGLIAGGMLKVFLLLATLALPDFASSQSYALLSALADAPFYYMPVFVAYGCASKLGGTPIYAMAVAAALVAPSFVQMVTDGDAVSLFGIPVMLVNYKNTLLPALLIGVCSYWVEKGLNKIVPGIFRSVFVGAGTIAITYVLGVTVLGPAGDFVGSIIVNVFVFLSEHVGFLALGLLAALLPWLIMTGMHHAISPFMTQVIADPGYDGIFRPSFVLHNMAEGGACLGVALRTRDKEFRSECLSLAVGCIVAGVTEPAIYGVTLRLRKPMIGVMAGGAAGGVVAGLLGAKAFMMGYSTVLALPIFLDTAWAMAIGIVVAIVAAAIVTYVLGIDEDDVESAAQAAGEE